MSEYRPEENDYIAYSDNEMFIVWNGSAHFTVFERKLDGSKLLSRFVDFDVEDYDHAQEIAQNWIDGCFKSS